MLALTVPTPSLPPNLAGQWQQREVSFVARRVLTAEEQEKLNDSTTADLNAQLRHGQTSIALTLAPAGGYRYVRSGQGGNTVSEAGTCRLSRDTFYLRPEMDAPAARLLPPILRVVRAGRRVLVLELPLDDPTAKVAQHQLYHRQ